MQSVAGALIFLLVEEMKARIETQKSGRTQLVFVGPPVALLDQLFDRLTASGTTDWVVEGIVDPVPVVLVGGSGPLKQPESCLSARATWGYVVTIRQNSPASLVLVGPREWDKQPESIENTSDRLGQPSPRTVRSFIAADPWPFLLGLVEEMREYPRPQVSRGLRDLWRDSRQLDQSEREALPWRAMDDLLRGKGLAESVGLPALAPGIELREGIRRGRQAMVALAVACAADGFAEVQQRLEDARAERRESSSRIDGATGFLPDENAIPAMFDYLRIRAGSAGAFGRSPAVFWRLDPEAQEDWWYQMTNEVLEDLLKSDRPPTRGKTLLRIGSLESPARDEPYVVVDTVELEVVTKTRDGTQPVETASFFRRSREGNEEWLDVDGGTLVDGDLPLHSKPIRYKAVVPDHADSTVRVIGLDTFACRGHAHVSGALRNPAPARRSRGLSPFEQGVVVRQAGIQRVVVLVRTDVHKVALQEPETPVMVAAVRDNRAEFTIYAEENSEKTVALLDSSDNVIDSWELAFQVEESTQGVVHSQFEDLVLKHQEGDRLRVVTARSCQARELETQAMDSEYSYRGLLGCWLPEGSTVGVVDWATCRVGEVSSRRHGPAARVRPKRAACRVPRGTKRCDGIPVAAPRAIRLRGAPRRGGHRGPRVQVSGRISGMAGRRPRGCSLDRLYRRVRQDERWARWSRNHK